MPPSLAGIRVLDLSRLLPGPFLTSIFAELGADVVKVEAPGVGDDTRIIPPEVDGAGYAFTATNRGKRSIAIDLKAQGAAELVLRLASRADVLVESFRPGVMDRFGLSDAALAAANPRLVRCSLVGYSDPEYRDDVGHDLNYQSLAGILALTGRVQAPPTQVADLGGALYAATAILAALLERERTGRGQRVEVALADAALAFNALPLARASAEPGGDAGWELTGTVPCYRTYRCADDRHVALAALEPKFWSRLAEKTGLDVAMQYDPGAHAAVEALFLRRPAAEWVATLRKAGVPITPVLSPEEVKAPSSPGAPLTRVAATGRPPALAEHADAVLAEAGFGAEERARLRSAGVFGR